MKTGIIAVRRLDLSSRLQCELRQTSWIALLYQQQQMDRRCTDINGPIDQTFQVLRVYSTGGVRVYGRGLKTTDANLTTVHTSVQGGVLGTMSCRKQQRITGRWVQ